MRDAGGAGPTARRLARLVVRAADAVTRRVTGLLGASPTAGRELISEAELRDLVAANTRLDPMERGLIDEVLAAGNRLVREVMVPRTEVVFLAADLPLAEAVALARVHTRSRFPVVDGTPDDVIGFVHLRDLLLRPEPDPVATVRQLAREVKRVPASKRVLPALSEMRREGQHLALVVDEYGGTAGIVCLEDLIEELVGEIHDEYDAVPEPYPIGLRPGAVDGRMNLADFAESTGLRLPPGPYETVGGFLMSRLGRLPRVGDEVALPAPGPGAATPERPRADAGGRRAAGAPASGWALRVLAVDGRRTGRVAIVPCAPAGAGPRRPTRAPAAGDG
ncbi:MAG TPA: hemolysin family protein [Pilimelia sp.]|nr:hemolysin family protein [Pilimelia sp.]